MTAMASSEPDARPSARRGLVRRLGAVLTLPGPERAGFDMFLTVAAYQLLADSLPELPGWFLNRPKQGFRFPFQLWLDDPAAPLALRLPSTPRGIDLAPWYRRWSLMVLQQWLELHLGVSLSRGPHP